MLEVKITRARATTRFWGCVRKRPFFSASAEVSSKRLQRHKVDKNNISDPEGFGLKVKIAYARCRWSFLAVSGNDYFSQHRLKLEANACRGVK